MEAAVLLPAVLGLLLLPLLAVLLTALCVRCRELPDTYAYDSAVPDSLPRSIMIKRPPNSVASYENEGASGPPGPWAGRLGPARAALTPCPSSEPACEDEDDEEDYHNEGYLVVLPDTVPATATATCTAVPAAAAPSNPGPRDSAFSMESGEDYVNVPESEESADASLDGSREYVNVSQDLQPTVRTESATLVSQEAEEEEEEGAPDYENLQELQ
ncbi:Linker for activation of T-cells family member 1 [Myotis davidii]|uniref:Linker for activation of T-cells family member 1 n=1 Tax=Myotis davidii TaxID=225400 RepID=L5MAL8_MYODS|nr:Linker for activation of T-cells family member 1 [Myotis davidii]